MTKIDVAVIGGGVAGCATALSLQESGCQTVVVERSNYETIRVGEHLSPEARPLLETLGLWQQFLAARHRPCPGTRSSWSAPETYDQDYIFSPYGHGWNLDRRNFDALLAAAAESAGAVIKRKARPVALEEVQDGWRVDSEIAGKRRQVEASFLVDATGRASAVARKLGNKRMNYDRLIGLAGWLTPESAADWSDATLLVEAIEDGWWYSTLLPEDKLVAVFMSDSDLGLGKEVRPERLWTERLQRTQHTQSRAAGFTLNGEILSRPANSFRLNRVSGRNWLAVAEAAAGLDPLSSMGIVRALQSGISAARTIVKYLSGDGQVLEEYENLTQAEFDLYLSERAAYYGRERRWPESEFWRRRQTPGGQLEH